MKQLHNCNSYDQAGFNLLEVLITLLTLAFGLIGLASLQTKIQVTNAEFFQRAQALLLVQDMANLLSTNKSNGASYVTGAATLGTGDNQPANCAALSGAQKDQCEWSNALKGAAEKQNAMSLGAMTSARGCIEQISANPAVYRISVAWQGMTELAVPSMSCGQNLYGNDGYRRTIANLVSASNLTAP